MHDPVSPEINLNNLQDVSIILNNLKVEYCVFFGTALGIYRNQGIIEHDDDIDFLVNSTHFDVVVEAMRQASYQQSSAFLQNSFSQFQKKTNSVTSYIDFYFFEDKGDYLLEKWNFRGTHWLPQTHIHIPKGLIYPLNIFSFPTFTTSVPGDMLGVCNYLYGERFMETLIKDKEYRPYIKNNTPQVEYL